MKKIFLLLLLLVFSFCTSTKNEDLYGVWSISKIYYGNYDYTESYYSNLINLNADSSCRFPTQTFMLSHLNDSVFGKWVPNFNKDGYVVEIEFQHWDTLLAGKFYVHSRLYSVFNGENILYGFTLENDKSTIVLRGRL